MREEPSLLRDGLGIFSAPPRPQLLAHRSFNASRVASPVRSIISRVAASDRALVCAECGRESTALENTEDSWRAYSDGVGELIVFCPECAEREFGE